MATLEQRCLIRTDPETAFQVSQDHNCRSRWDPFTRKIERTQDGRVIITAWHGMRMEVEYVSWRAPERAAIRMVGGPPMLEQFAGTWSFSQHAPGIVEARFRYQIKAAAAWRHLEPLVLCYFEIETKRRLVALKRHLERMERSRREALPTMPPQRPSGLLPAVMSVAKRTGRWIVALSRSAP